MMLQRSRLASFIPHTIGLNEAAGSAMGIHLQEIPLVESGEARCCDVALLGKQRIPAYNRPSRTGNKST